MAAAGFWDDQEKAQSVIQRLKAARGIVDKLGSLDRDVTDLVDLIEMTEDDDSQDAELLTEMQRLTNRQDELELATLLSGPHDAAPAIISIQAGNGGTDANDFAEMLMRM